MELRFNFSLLLNKRVILKSFLLFILGRIALAILETFLKFSGKFILNNGFLGIQFDREFIVLLLTVLAAVFVVIIGVFLGKVLMYENKEAYRSILCLLFTFYLLYSILFWTECISDFFDFIIFNFLVYLGEETFIYELFGTVLEYFLVFEFTELYFCLYIVVLTVSSVFFRKSLKNKYGIPAKAHE